MYKNISIIIFTAIIYSGCTAEGNSRFLEKGGTKYFLTMSACKKEALSEYASGGKKYTGFECRKMLLGIFQLESITY